MSLNFMPTRSVSQGTSPRIEPMKKIIGKAAGAFGRLAGLLGDAAELAFEILDMLDGAKKTANKKAKVKRIKK